jgi:two-component system sensor histidine kinase BaeS
MQLRLWQRLFIAFAALSVLALAGFAAWQQQEFRRGFLGYLDEVALERLQPASVRLANAYAESGSWDFLRAQPNRFGELIDVRPQRRDRHPPPDSAPNADASRAPPFPPDDAPPPPRPGEFDGPRDGARPGRPPPHGPPDLMPRLLLLDASGAFVAGNRNVPLDAPSVPVELEGRRIGTLHLAPLPQLNDALDLAFAREQVRNAMLTGIAVLAGAFVLAFALARWLLKPVHALAEGTRALAAGNYERRVGVERKDELGRLAEDFNHLAATLEQHREARRRWGADIAHELRTPLSVLRGEIQALQDGVRQTTPAALDSLQAECDRLGGLIEDLYQLSLADAGALEYRFETIDFGEIVRESVDAQRGMCADAGLSIEESITGEVHIRGDARRLTQLVDNLLANARCYTDAPGRIRVELVRVCDGARLVVEDTAPGVPADAMPRLFERLYRVESSRVRAAGGAGLGLAICRAIVEAHSGRIDATASSIGGLRITVDLPGGDA